MRLGGPIFEHYTDPDSWVGALKDLNYSAAYCPEVVARSGAAQEYARAAKQADIFISEVVAWSNPLSPDEQESKKAIQSCQEKLALADEIGAACCVNIVGSRSKVWDAPHPDNLTDATFDMIVASVREIIDAVKPTRTFYTLETMPWMYPDSVESYLRLIQAIDRKAFAVHYDPVNLVCSPQRYFGNVELIREFVAQLGPYIKGVHAKDIKLQEKLTTHLDEVIPGQGYIDYRVLLRELDKLGPDIPVMVEHLEKPEEYAQAVSYIRGVAKKVDVNLKG